MVIGCWTASGGCNSVANSVFFYFWLVACCCSWELFVVCSLLFAVNYFLVGCYSSLLVVFQSSGSYCLPQRQRSWVKQREWKKESIDADYI